MNKTTPFKCIITATLTLATTSAFAQDNDTPFSASVSAGFEYDSNITVDSIDSNTNVGDTAFILEGSAGYNFIETEEQSFNVGYDFSQSLHSDITAFDMQIHGFNADGRYTIDWADLGMAYSYNYVTLGGDGFLGLHTLTPSLGFLTASNQVYVIAAYEYQKQNFKSPFLTMRNANRNSLSGSAIFLLGDDRSFNAGYTYTDHNATSDAYSYTGHTLNLSLKLPVEIIDKEATFRTGYKLQTRSYDAESLIYNDEIRSDKRHTLSASLEAPLFDRFSGIVSYEFIGSNSNYDVVDYNESILTAKMEWNF